MFLSEIHSLNGPEFSGPGGPDLSDEEVFDPDLSFTGDQPLGEDDLTVVDSLPAVELSTLGQTPDNPMDSPDEPGGDEHGNEPDAETPIAAGGGGDDLTPPTDDLPSPVPEEPDRHRPRSARLPLPPLVQMQEYDLRISEQKVDALVQQERAAQRGYLDTIWDASDSSLETGRHSFESWFCEVLPTDGSLKSYIVSTLSSLDHRLGIELGGPGSQMFSEFPRGFFEETAGVTLTDTRLTSSDLRRIIGRDESRKHQVVEGNIIAPQTKEDVDRWLNGRKLGLVMERMFAGADTLPKDPFTLAQNANHWYERLAEGGLMFAQIPSGLRLTIDEWKQMIDNGGYNLDVQIGRYEGYGLARIHKLLGAPEQLPLLSARGFMQSRWDSRDLSKWRRP